MGMSDLDAPFGSEGPATIARHGARSRKTNRTYVENRSQGSKVGAHTFLLSFCLLGFYALSSSGEVPGGQVREIVDQADITYTTAFTLSCAKKTWEGLVENPLLVGALWERYGYAPAYRVSQKGDTLHVEDPTGLVGDVLAFRPGPDQRIYLVEGRIDHWAIPFFNEGRAVFVLKSQVAQGRVDCTLEVYVRAESPVARLALQIGRPLLLKHVDNRITLNLQDAMKICEAVDTTPQNVLALLEGETARFFKAVFY